MDITANLPPVKAAEFRIHPVSGKLRMATYGRGVYELDVSSSATPQEASPSGDLLASRGSGTSIDVSFADACGASDHTVYAGDLNTLQAGGPAWNERFCTQGVGGSLNFDPGPNEMLYFVVVGNDGVKEGSYGIDSAGLERNPADPGGACQYSQELLGSCP